MLKFAPIGWDPYFWNGMVCASLGQEAEAMVAIVRALKAFYTIYTIIVYNPDKHPSLYVPLLYALSVDCSS
jgi:hypothetical protein